MLIKMNGSGKPGWSGSRVLLLKLAFDRVDAALEGKGPRKKAAQIKTIRVRRPRQSERRFEDGTASGNRHRVQVQAPGFRFGRPDGIRGLSLQDDLYRTSPEHGGLADRDRLTAVWPALRIHVVQKILGSPSRYEERLIPAGNAQQTGSEFRGRLASSESVAAMVHPSVA
jgi:hypothetical protein